MGVDATDAHAVEAISRNEAQHFGIRGDRCLRQFLQGTEYGVTILQVAQGEFANHEGMRQPLPLIEQAAQAFVALVQVVNSDRRIDQDHGALVWRLGGATSCGSEPPSSASRLALSR